MGSFTRIDFGVAFGEEKRGHRKMNHFSLSRLQCTECGPMISGLALKWPDVLRNTCAHRNVSSPKPVLGECLNLVSTHVCTTSGSQGQHLGPPKCPSS